MIDPNENSSSVSFIIFIRLKLSPSARNFDRPLPRNSNRPHDSSGES